MKMKEISFCFLKYNLFIIRQQLVPIHPSRISSKEQYEINADTPLINYSNESIFETEVEIETNDEKEIEIEAEDAILDEPSILSLSKESTSIEESTDSLPMIINQENEENEEPQKYKHQPAIIPPLYYEINEKLHISTVELSEMISLWDECIKNKVERWSNAELLVKQCWKLHEKYMDHIHYNNNTLSIEYASKLTHILSNSINNKQRIFQFIEHLKEHNLCDMKVFQTLLDSCYSENTFERRFLNYKCTGDTHLARFIFRRYTLQFQFTPNESIIRSLLMACVRRGHLELAMQILFELKEQNINIQLSAFRVVFDICSIKHSITYADMLMNFILSKYESSVNVLNMYLNVCWICGNWEKALQMINYFRSKNISPNLISINLLLKSYSTNAEIYSYLSKIDVKEHQGYGQTADHSYFVPAYVLQELEINENKHGRKKKQYSHSVHIGSQAAYGQPLEMISLLLNKYGNYYSSSSDSISREKYKKHILRIFERLSFYAGRYETNDKFRRTFYIVQSFHKGFVSYNNYKSNDWMINLMGDEKIMYNFLLSTNRRSKRMQYLLSSIDVWSLYAKNCEYKNVDMYVLMMNICTWNVAFLQFRALGLHLCSQMKKIQFLHSQKIYDAVLNFYASEKNADEGALDVMDKTSNFSFEMTEKTIIAWLRISLKQNNVQILHEITCKISTSSSSSLIKSLIRSFSHFNYHTNALLFLNQCILYQSHSEIPHKQRIIHNKYDIAFCIYHILQSYITSHSYSACIQHFIFNDDNQTSDFIKYCWEYQLFVADHITFLMYCCYQSNDINAILHVLQLILDSYTLKNAEIEDVFSPNIDSNIVNVSCYNWCSELLIKLYGNNSPSVLQIIEQFMVDGIWYCNYKQFAKYEFLSQIDYEYYAHQPSPMVIEIVLSLTSMTANIVPIALRMYINIYNEFLRFLESDEQSFIDAGIDSRFRNSEIELRFRVLCYDNYWMQGKNEWNNQQMKGVENYSWQSDSNQAKKKKQSSVYRLLFSEDSYYLMSAAQKEFVTKYFPCIECQMNKNCSEMICILPKTHISFLVSEVACIEQ